MHSAHSSDNVTSGLGRTVAYAGYNLGGGIIVGLVRTIIALAYIAKHAFYKAQYEDASEAQRKASEERFSGRRISRHRENAAAREKTREATGFGKVSAGLGEAGTRIVNGWRSGKDSLVQGAEEFVNNVQDEFTTEFIQDQADCWKEQFYRGIAELLLPLIGTLYFTYVDNFAGKKVSIIESTELYNSIQAEGRFDDMARELIDSYDPLY